MLVAIELRTEGGRQVARISLLKFNSRSVNGLVQICYTSFEHISSNKRLKLGATTLLHKVCCINEMLAVINPHDFVEILGKFEGRGTDSATNVQGSFLRGSSVVTAKLSTTTRKV